MEPEVGIEPTTYRLQGHSSTAIMLSTSGYAAPAVGGVHHMHPAERVSCHEWCHAAGDRSNKDKRAPRLARRDCRARPASADPCG